MDGLKKRILSEIMTYKGFRRQAQLAQFLDISPQLLNKWFTRDTFDVEVLIKKLPEVNLDFLLYGKQPMLRKYVKADNSNKEQPEMAISEEPASMANTNFLLSKELEIKNRQISSLIEQHGILISELSNIIKEISESGKRIDQLIEKIMDK